MLDIPPEKTLTAGTQYFYQPEMNRQPDQRIQKGHWKGNF
jgi:hypothetical protein